MSSEGVSSNIKEIVNCPFINKKVIVLDLSKMSGRSGGRHGGKGGCGSGNNQKDSTSGRGGHGGGNRSRPTKVGLNKELEGNVFDLGERSSAYLLRTTQIKIAQYIGSQYGGDIMGELEMKRNSLLCRHNTLPVQFSDNRITRI